jgi:hypothetical protein
MMFHPGSKRLKPGIDIRVARVAEAEKKTVVTLEIQLLEKVSPDEADVIKNTIKTKIEEDFENYQVVIKSIH